MTLPAGSRVGGMWVEAVQLNGSAPYYAEARLDYRTPVAGEIVEVNPAMNDAPEAINQDPYGTGWLAVIEVADWEAQKGKLLTPQVYFDLMKGQAEEETRKL